MVSCKIFKNMKFFTKELAKQFFPKTNSKIEHLINIEGQGWGEGHFEKYLHCQSWVYIHITGHFTFGTNCQGKISTPYWGLICFNDLWQRKCCHLGILFSLIYYISRRGDIPLFKFWEGGLIRSPLQPSQPLFIAF